MKYVKFMVKGKTLIKNYTRFNWW